LTEILRVLVRSPAIVAILLGLQHERVDGARQGQGGKGWEGVGRGGKGVREGGSERRGKRVTGGRETGERDTGEE